MADYEPIIKASSVNRPTYGRLVVRNGTLVNVAKTDSGKNIGSLCADAGNVRWIYGSAAMFVNGGGPEDGEDISNPNSIECCGDEIRYRKIGSVDVDYGNTAFNYNSALLKYTAISTNGQLFNFSIEANGVKWDDQYRSYKDVQDVATFKNILSSFCDTVFKCLDLAKSGAKLDVKTGKFIPSRGSKASKVQLGSKFSWMVFPTATQIEYQKSFEFRLSSRSSVILYERRKMHIFYFPLHKKSIRIGVRCFNFKLMSTLEESIASKTTGRVVMNVYSPKGLAANQRPTSTNQDPIYGTLIRTASTRYFSGGEEVPDDVWIEANIPATKLGDNRMLVLELFFELKPPTKNDIVDAALPYYGSSDEKIITSLTFKPGSPVVGVENLFNCDCDFHCWFDGSLVEGAGA